VSAIAGGRMDSNEDYAGAIAMEGTKTYAALAWFPLPVF